ncbi:hypothetical protein T01_3351 [Trichinella spiralis]|uniref:Uncharacterized protein n=1 Tax=Trichinella spiralis TaxID=6334 RepID=A0A0V1AUM9_TRISP|nr:hypothetical protein T01_3351 [Trichinella spiralis]
MFALKERVIRLNNCNLFERLLYDSEFLPSSQSWQNFCNHGKKMKLKMYKRNFWLKCCDRRSRTPILAANGGHWASRSMFLNCWLASKLRSIETFMLCSNAVLDSRGVGNNSVDLSHKQANRVNIDINLNVFFLPFQPNKIACKAGLSFGKERLHFASCSRYFLLTCFALLN